MGYLTLHISVCYSVKDATGGDLFAYRSERASLHEKDHVSVFTGNVYL